MEQAKLNNRPKNNLSTITMFDKMIKNYVAKYESHSFCQCSKEEAALLITLLKSIRTVT